MVRAYFFGVCLMAICLGHGIGYAAQGKDLRAAEWASWPDYCKVAFLSSGWSENSPYAAPQLKGWAAQLRSSLLEPMRIPGPHHFCVGMIYVNRARNATANQRSTGDLRMALDEINYSLSRMEKSSPSYSLIMAYFGTAHYLLGDRAKATGIWEDGIRTQPERRESYLAMVQALLSEKRYKEALERLLDYDGKKEYATADGEYFLAYTYLELGDYDQARIHADQAYALGYPFPGLRDKLKKLEKSQ